MSQRKNKAWRLLLLPALAGFAALAPAMALSATPKFSAQPQHLALAAGQVTTSRISWNVTGTYQVYVSTNGATEVFFATATGYGYSDASFITGGNTYVFRLYYGTNHKAGVNDQPSEASATVTTGKTVAPAAVALTATLQAVSGESSVTGAGYDAPAANLVISRDPTEDELVTGINVYRDGVLVGGLVKTNQVGVPSNNFNLRATGGLRGCDLPAASQFYSSTQGQHGWSYWSAPGGVMQPMVFESSANAWGQVGAWHRPGTNNWLWSTGGHPDYNSETIRRWTAPSAGTLSIPRGA